MTARGAWFLGLLFAGLAGPASAAAPLAITSGPDYGIWQVGRVEAPITVTGGTGSYSYTVTGSLPPGVGGQSESHPPSWWPVGTNYGLVGVTPTPGTYNFTISVFDGVNTVIQNATIKIPSILVIDEYQMPNGVEWSPYFRQLHYSSPVPGPYTFSLQGGSLPAGITLTSGGVLQGMPTGGSRGTYNFTVALNQNGETVYRGFTITVLPSVIFGLPILPPTTAGGERVVTISNPVVNVQLQGPSPASNWYVSGNSLPPGLSLSSNGLLSGTISGPGTWSFQISANDATGLAAQDNLTIQYRPGATASNVISMWGAGSLNSATVGQSYYWTFGASNGVIGPSGYSWTITSGSLPQGMYLATGTNQPQAPSNRPGGATILGAPRATGSYTFTLTATDFSTPPVSVSQTYTLNVVALDADWQWTPFAIRNIPGYNGYLRILGGTPPYNVTLAPDSQPLPSGATLNADGSITGQIFEGGNFYPSLRIQDNSASPIVLGRHGHNLVVNSDVGGTFQIGIDPSAPFIAVRNQSYNFTVRAFGGSGTYQWRTQNGSLPPGLSLSTAGPSPAVNITGVPTTAGTYQFDVVATDNANLSYYAFKHYILTVTNLALVGNGNLTAANIGTAYSTNLSVSGAVGSVTWTLAPGQVLPPGLTLSSNGVLSGMPTSNGQYFFSAIATDSGVSGSTVTYFFNISIYPVGQPAITVVPPGQFYPLGRLELPFALSGGTGVFSASIVGGSLPPGVALRTSGFPSNWNGSPVGLVGMLTSPGTWSFTVRFTSGTATMDLPVTVTALPIVDTSPFVLPDGVTGAGSGYSAQLTAASALSSSNFDWSLAPGQSLPAGLVLTNLGLITGIITEAPNTYTFSVSLHDSVTGSVYTWQHRILVRNYAIASPPILPSASQGAAYTYQFTTSGATGSVSWIKTFDTIPNGLTLSSSGMLSGTPASAGTYRFTLQSTDGAGKVNQKTFGLYVAATPPALMSPGGEPFGRLQDLPVGEYRYYEVWANNGVAPYTYALHSGSSLPPGMALLQGSSLPNAITSSPYEAVVAGVPIQPGTYTFTVDITDSSSPAVTSSRAFTLKVATLSNNTFDTAAQAQAYAKQLYMIGGQSPYTVQFVPGGPVSYVAEGYIRLPNGMSLSSGGLLSGTPTESGTFFLPLLMTDANNVTFQRPVQIQVNSASSNPLGFCSNPLLPSASTGLSYSTTLCASNGSGIYSWSVVSGALPVGLTLNSATGVLAGTTSSGGSYSFAVQVTDNANTARFVRQQLCLNVTALFSNQSSNLPFGNVGTLYSQTLTVGNSDPSLQVTLEPDSALPPGLTLSSTGSLSGTPTSAGRYFFNVRFTTVIGAGGFVIQNYNVFIYPAGTVPPLVWTTGPNYGVWNGAIGKIGLNASGGRPPYTFSFAPSNSLENFRVQNGQPLPANFNSPGILAGVALTTGLKTVTLRVTDADGQTVDQAASMTFSTIGAMMPGSLPWATNGMPYSQQLRVDGAAGYIFQPAGTLPAGMSLSTSGVLSGTPATGVGNFNVPFKLVDGGNNFIGSWSYNLPVQALAISWPGAPGALPNATVGIPYGNKTLTATGGSGTGYVWSINQFSLPGGMSLSTDGVISGTPTGYTNSTFQVKVTDSANNSALAWMQLSVIPAGPVAPTVALFNPPSFTVGVYDWFFVNIVGGAAPYTVSSDTPLPAGLSLVQNLPGRDLTPGIWYLQGRTMAAPGTYPLTLRVTDSFNNQATQSYNLIVSPIWLDTNNLPDRGTLTYGTPFNQQLLILGGSGSYNVTATQPMLTGLNVSTGGTVSGTPTSTGTIYTLLSIVDAADPTRIRTQNLQTTAAATSPFTLSINNGPDLGTFATGNTFTNLLTATGSNANPPNYVFTLEPGSALPPGVSIFSGSSLPNGFSAPAFVLGGECRTPGNYTFTIRVTDANGNFGLKQMTMRFSGSSLLSITTLPVATLNVPYSIQLYSASASGAITYTLAAGSGLPPGMSLTPAGLLSGTPTLNGLFPFTVLIGDGVTPVLSRTFSLRVQGIAITSPDTLVYTLGTPSPFTFTQTGAIGPVTWSWSASNPLCGLTLNTSTGAVTGTPSGCTLNSFQVTASDGTNTATQPVAIWFHGAVSTLSLASSFIVDASAGQGYFATVNALSGVAPYTYSLAPGSSLPPGLQLATNTPALKSIFSAYTPGTAAIFGVPTTPGNYTFTLLATDTGLPQQTAAMTYTMTVSPVVLENNNIHQGTYNVPYSQMLPADGPNGPVTCSLAYGFLPTGITLSNGCLLSGTPTDTGNFTLGIQMSDGGPYPIVKRLTLTINATSTTTLTLTTGYPVDGSVGTLQSARNFSVSGGASPYSFVLQPGSQVPPGMTFTSSGSISSITNPPAVPGLYSLTVRATDSTESPNFGQRTYKFNVSPMQLPLGTTSLQTIARVGQPYSYTLPIAGGTPPYTFTALPAGTSPTGFGNYPMPPGLSLAANGQIAGTPLGTGIFTPAIRVTDSAGASFLFQPGITISMPGVPVPISASVTISINASAGMPMSFPLDNNPLPGGGFWYVVANSPVTWTLHAGSVLPNGVSLVPGSGNSSYLLAGTPAVPGTYTFSLDLTDVSGQILTKAVTLVVSALTATPNTLPGGTVGATYSAAMTASGGAPPYTFTSFGLPPGLSITASGSISGTPAYAGRFQGGITITDSTPVTPKTLNRPFTIVIAGSGTVIPLLTASPQTLQVSYQQGDPLPGPIPLNAGSSTGAPIPFTAGTATLQGGNWLTLSSSSGTAPSSMTISVNPTGLIPGIYNGVVTLTGAQPDNGTVSLPVSLTVSAPAPCSYALSPGSGTIAAAGGTLNIGVASGAQCSWSASTPAAYVTFQGGGAGTGNGTATVNVAPNPNATQRTANITIGGQDYTLTQFGQTCSFTLSPGLISIPAGGGGVLTNLSASAGSCPWTASSNSGFVTLDAGVPASGTGSQTLSMTVTPNAGAAARQGTVTIGGQTLTINQDGINCSTSLGSSSANVAYSGGAVSVPVTATCGFNITPGPSWIAIAGTTPSSVNLSITPNSSTQPRTGSIQIGGLPFQVIEDGVPCSFSLGNNNPVIGSSGGNGSITITASGGTCGWVASSNANFLGITSAASGTGSGTLSFSVGPNSSQNGRSGTISIAGQNVTISQGGLVCGYDLQSSGATVNGLGGTGLAGVITAPGCTYTAASNAPWINITSGATGSGSGDVGFTAAANPSAASRSGALTVAGKTFTVTQGGMPCSYTLGTGSASLATGGGSGSFTIQTAAGCSPKVQSFAGWLNTALTFDSNTGAGTVNFTAQSNPTPAVRTATISVDDQTFTVNVAASPCSYNLPITAATFGRMGGTSFVRYLADPPACTPSITAPSPITLLGTTTDAILGQDINYGVSPYLVYVNWVRTMQINISGNLFTVKQTSW